MRFSYGAAVDKAEAEAEAEEEEDTPAAAFSLIDGSHLRFHAAEFNKPNSYQARSAIDKDKLTRAHTHTHKHTHRQRQVFIKVCAAPR